MLGAVLSTCGVCGASGPECSDVFVAGHDGYPSIRIPAVVVTHAGSVLAFAEGRARHADQAHNQLILRRSTDGGRTWGAVQKVAADGDNSLNNPCAVVEQATGRVLVMYQRIPAHLEEASAAIEPGFDGPNVYRTLLTVSDDDGLTWSAPRDVTRGTKHATGATTVASGPGIGIQLTRGSHQGRLLMPFNEGPFWQWNNYAAYSDDGGETWQCGENVPGAIVDDPKHGRRSQINEVQFVELSDGSVRLNSRQFAGTRLRKTSVSHDGGVTWSKVEDVGDLLDPCCQGSILRFHDMLLYSGPDSGQRANGTVHVSLDDGRSWPVRRVLEAGSFGYSCLTALADGTLGCLYETDGANRLVFARFSLEWVLGESGPRAR